jgi:ABC-type dipeptide/oligopeptide/nickel transport system permease component
VTTYILRRLLLMFPTLLGITLVVFVVMAAAPGGISAQALVDGLNLEPQAKKALEDYYNRRYGLDQPAPVQYLRWLNNVSPVGFRMDEATGELGRFSLLKGSDLGTSFRYGRPVMDLIAERLPITLLLNVISIPLIYVIAIAVGVHAATRRGSSFDVSSSVVMLGLWSVPTMLAGVLMIGFFASDQFWRWFPTGGLSRREALDMPFLPHWGSLGDVLVVCSAGGYRRCPAGMAEYQGGGSPAHGGARCAGCGGRRPHGVPAGGHGRFRRIQRGDGGAGRGHACRHRLERI